MLVVVEFDLVQFQIGLAWFLDVTAQLYELEIIDETNCEHVCAERSSSSPSRKMFKDDKALLSTPCWGLILNTVRSKVPKLTASLNFFVSWNLKLFFNGFLCIIYTLWFMIHCVWMKKARESVVFYQTNRSCESSGKLRFLYVTWEHPAF